MSLYDVDVEHAGRRRTVWRWFLLHPPADYAWAVLAVLMWLGLAWLLKQPLMLEGVDPGARRTLFQTLATLAGATAGLTLTSVSMLINVLGKRRRPGGVSFPRRSSPPCIAAKSEKCSCSPYRALACWWWLPLSPWYWRRWSGTLDSGQLSSSSPSRPYWRCSVWRGHYGGCWPLQRLESLRPEALKKSGGSPC